MDYYIMIWSVCSFVESRVRDNVNLEELAQETGFSLAHMRDVFRKHTGKSLSSYIKERRIACAAQELLLTDKTVLEIALEFGFTGRDVFSRAFRRYTGYTPAEFREKRPIQGRVRLCAGVFGAALPQKREEKDT